MLNVTANGRDEVIDVTDATFIAEVLEVSKIRPVLVDFWAPWCAPCRALGPVLEKAVAATEGRVRLVKVNVDENQVFARKLQVQSIPAVFAFHGGHPVDGFMGNLAPSRIAEFVARLIERSDPDRISVEDALAAAEEMMEAGNAVDAMEVYAQLLEQDPECLPAIAGMVTAQIKVGQLEIERLRTLAEDRLGDAFDPAAFHDVVLGSGAVTLPVLAGMVEDWLSASAPTSPR